MKKLMVEPSEIFVELMEISKLISKVAKLTGYSDYGDMSLLEIDRTKGDDLFYYDEIEHIVEKLDYIQGKVDYIMQPVKYESTLMINEDGRYETQQEDVFTSGRSIEYISHDGRYHDYSFWRKSRIEYKDEGYYIVAEPHINLQGLKVRIRREL